MKILFISNSPINRQTSIGNTFLNLFDGFDAELYSVYSRTGYPDKKIKSATEQKFRSAFLFFFHRLVQRIFAAAVMLAVKLILP